MTKWMRAAVMAVLVTAVTACDDDSTGPDEHADEVAIIRLTIGSQVFNITEGGAQGGLTIPVGSHPVTAVFLAADNDVLTLGSDFRLDFNTENASVVTFTRTGALSGTLNGVAAGTAVVRVGVFHLEEGHYDFGTHPINVTVQ